MKKNDFEQWYEVRVRCRDWLEQWEPAPEPNTPYLLDKDAFAKRCHTFERQRHFDSAYGFGLFLTDETFVGELSIGNIQRGPMQSANIGYWIDEIHAGKGYVPEAVVLLLTFAFESLNLHRIEVAIVPRNRASRRVVEKLKFREEGISERLLKIRGAWEDHVRYAITREEWLDRRHDLESEFLGTSD